MQSLYPRGSQYELLLLCDFIFPYIMLRHSYILSVLT